MIWSSVRRFGGGAIITPAAPASIVAFASERIEAKPGAETPTMTCRFFALDETDRDLLGLGGIELRRFAQNAEHRDAFAADLRVEIGQAVDRALVDAAIVMERRRRDQKGACGFGGESDRKSV